MKLYFIDTLVHSDTDLYSLSGHVMAGNVRSALEKFCESRRLDVGDLQATEIKNVTPAI